MSISAAKASNFGREQAGIFASKDKPLTKHTQYHHSEAGEDQLELSTSATDLLHNLHKQSQALFKAYPQHSGYFLNAKQTNHEQALSQAIHFITKSKQFLNDPHFKDLSKQDHEFSSFYNEIHRLASHHEEALKRIQAESRNSSAISYHKLIQSGA